MINDNRVLKHEKDGRLIRKSKKNPCSGSGLTKGPCKSRWAPPEAFHASSVRITRIPYG